MLVVKYVLFVLVLVYASYCDIKTRIIPDRVHIIIILLGLINLNWIPSILGLVLVPLPFLVVALVRNGSMGGGDVKLVGACSFYLGFTGGLIGSSVGLAFGILTSILYSRYKLKKYNGKIALVPYLGVGYLLIMVNY
ncbi:prepilin peptidase [Vallitalea guaymasensis]|uniref:Prepilin peptidase n=1 Tax=Vallitalea guaymasensis TaxID=1185412 RepID=A0A8J8MDU0_9FIRM|nr:A24 family peptidase [Vallitalea guaymasensis]QUH31112.1 prepilin peptidase [Vallitalea guaymasensis]